MNKAEKAILKAFIDGTLTELLVKTSAEQVYLDETTNLATKLTEMISAINDRAKTSDMNTAIVDAVNALREEMFGGNVNEALNSFAELAQFLDEHEEFSEALSAAVANKADKATVEALQASIAALGSLAGKSSVSESDLDAALKAKVNAAAEGNHSHDNKSVLDGITAAKISSWDAKTKVYIANEKPAAMTSNDFLIQLV